MDNLTGTPNWKLDDLPVLKNDNNQTTFQEEEYVGINLEMGNIVNIKKRPDYGTGVVVKKLPNNNYWVVLPEKKNEHLSSMPWEFNVFNIKDIELFNN